MTNLDLSNNQISDINGLIENDLLCNLNYLNMSYNNITDISPFSKGKFNDLIILNLSYNKISNIDILQSDSKFERLELLDLSNNLINKLVKINIKHLKELNLLNNKINSGFNDFIESISNYSDYLFLEKSIYSISFNFDKNLKANFTYYIRDDVNIAQFLKKLSFSGIHSLEIKNFNNDELEFLANESLKGLNELDLTDNKINNLSIFKNIHFHNIKKIEFCYNILDNGFENLKIFPSIKVKSITTYRNKLYIKFCDPEFGLYFSDFNILLDDLINKREEFVKEINF